MKTKLGISIGAMAVIVYLTALFGGYIPLFLLAGYVLLVEGDEWLKRMSVKAVVLALTASTLYWLVALIPDVIGLINDLIVIFDGKTIYLEFLSELVNLILAVISFAETVLFLLLSFKALKKSTLYIPLVDPIVNKFLSDK
ncbi:MAG: hypothetical protein E7582_03375 [Ruminococcaceae bacterium]|nr:hypothetical protein [Oscillospiraceae bacterium]